MRSSQAKRGSGREAAEKLNAFTADGAGPGHDPTQAWYAREASPVTRGVNMSVQAVGGDQHKTTHKAQQGIGADVAENRLSAIAHLKELDAELAEDGFPTPAELEEIGADMARFQARMKAELARTGDEWALDGAQALAKLARTPDNIERCYQQRQELWDAPEVDTQALEQRMLASLGLPDDYGSKSEEWLTQELDRILGPLVK